MPCSLCVPLLTAARKARYFSRSPFCVKRAFTSAKNAENPLDFGNWAAGLSAWAVISSDGGGNFDCGVLVSGGFAEPICFVAAGPKAGVFANAAFTFGMEGPWGFAGNLATAGTIPADSPFSGDTSCSPMLVLFAFALALACRCFTYSALWYWNTALRHSRGRNALGCFVCVLGTFKASVRSFSSHSTSESAHSLVVSVTHTVSSTS
mmetsp:Transcript_53117/g.105495  ORF Transcript_53117/g.105495 Transcript_53117/m.105495 type:complete len:207 (-) Transcript_53117:274-894(-)